MNPEIGLLAGTPSPEAPCNPLAARQAHPVRIAVFGLFGCGNLGNDGSLAAMLEFLSRARPGAEIVCICDRPEVVAGKMGVATTPISRSRRAHASLRRMDRMFLRLPGKILDFAHILRLLARSNALVVPGTGILDDFGERPYGMPLDILLWCFAARSLGLKVALVSIGAGPIGNPLSRRLMKAAARCAHYRSYRDRASRDFMESIAFDTGHDPVFPDLVFGLQEPNQPRRPAGTLNLGLGVMSYYGWYGFAEGGQAIFANYVARISDLAVRLLDAGHRIRLLTGEEGDSTARDAVIQTIADARPREAGRVAVEPIGSLEDLMREMGRTDLVVATRFHNIVCALKMGKPTISLGYSRKNDVLMAEAGLAEFCHHVERFDPGTVFAQIEQLAAEIGRHRSKIRDYCASLKDEIATQEKRLLAVLP